MELSKPPQILAPNNDAFNKIPYSELSQAFSSNNQDVITNVLEYHILQGSRTAAELVPGNPVFIPTLLTNKAYTNVSGGQRVQNIKQSGDVVVFVSGQGSRSTLTQAVSVYICPLFSWESGKADNFQDLIFNGGVVQVIDSLLIPPGNLTATLNPFNLTAFEGSLYTANKLESFLGTANSTIFAPSNDAFQSLGPAISNMTVEQLSSVLDYHLLPQVLYSTSLTNGTKFLTQQGENVTILHAGNNIYVNSAQLLNLDLICANGVIHVIDNVLNPQGPGATPNPAIASQGPVFASASEVSTLPFTTAIPCTSSCPVTSSSVSGSGSKSATGGAGTKATSLAGSQSSSVSTSSSKALAVAVARETGFHAAGLMVALGGAVMMI